MDIDKYFEILKWRGEDPHIIGDTGMKIGLTSFHKDVLLNKAVWWNDKQKDFRYWLYSHHPLISLMKRIRGHPYSLKYCVTRMLFLITIGSYLAFLAAFALTEMFKNTAFRIFQELVITIILCSVLNSFLIFMFHTFLQYLCIRSGSKSLCFCVFKCLAMKTPVLILIIAIIINILCAIYISLHMNVIDLFAYIFPFQFMFLFIFQLIALRMTFEKQWNVDHELLSTEITFVPSATMTTYNNNHNSNRNKTEIELTNTTTNTTKSNIQMYDHTPVGPDDDDNDNSEDIFDSFSTASVTKKCPYFVTFRDYQEYMTFLENQHSSGMNGELLPSEGTLIANNNSDASLSARLLMGND